MKFIDMFVDKIESVNIPTKQERDDTDVLIIETVIEDSLPERTAVII